LAGYVFNQPKPSIEVTSIGFRGALKGAPIPLDGDLVVLASGSRWTDPLFQFEDFGHLAEVERQAAESMARLTRALGLVEAWAKQVRLGEPDPPAKRAFLTVAQVKQHPMTNEPMVLSSIEAAITGNEITRPPRTIEDLRAGVVLFQPYDDKAKGVIFIHGPNSPLALPFPYHGLPAEAALRMRLFAESTARGSRENLLFYSRSFIAAGRDEARRLAEVRHRLQAILLPSACLSASVTIRNGGKTAITLVPWFILHISADELEQRLFVMTVNTVSEKTASSQSAANGEGPMTAGRRVFVKHFLSDYGSLSYINVPPGEIREVALVGTDQLGADAGRIKQLYDKALIQCQVIGMSTQGDLVTSTAETFRDGIYSARDRLVSEWRTRRGAGSTTPQARH
jgi:hypothetical protein